MAMMSNPDLVTRLRQRADAIADCYDDSHALLREAADAAETWKFKYDALEIAQEMTVRAVLRDALLIRKNIALLGAIRALVQREMDDAAQVTDARVEAVWRQIIQLCEKVRP